MSSGLTGTDIQKIAIEEAKREGEKAGIGILYAAWPNLTEQAAKMMLDGTLTIKRNGTIVDRNGRVLSHWK